MLFVDKIWVICKEIIENFINVFIKEGYDLNIKDYKYLILLVNLNSFYIILSDGYWGDGGIFGYIFLLLVFNEYIINRLLVLIVYECNYNIRF